MGKIIAFWSPYQGTSKVTSSLCAVAGAFGLLYPELHVAISRTKQGGTELEGKLDYRAGPQKSLYEKSGLTALALNYINRTHITEKNTRKRAFFFSS